MLLDDGTDGSVCTSHCDECNMKAHEDTQTKVKERL